MAEIRIDASELPARLGHALEWLAAGDDVLLTSAGEPVARLARLAGPAERPTAAPEFMKLFDGADPAAFAKGIADLAEGFSIPNDMEEWAILEQEEEWLQGIGLE